MQAEVLAGDCLVSMRGVERGSVDLVATDPPYHTGKQWSGSAGGYDDRWASRVAFLSYMRERAVAMHELLADTGSLYWQCDPRISHHLQVMLDEVFGERNFLNQVVWSYRRWSGRTRKYQSMHDIILFYAKDAGRHVWNAPTEPKSASYVPYKTWHVKDEETGRLKKCYDKTKLVPETAMRDVWDVTYLQSSERERVGYPTQKPVRLFERMVLASSAPGGLVLDPFCGSGTTLVAAVRHGRRAIGMDANRDAVKAARQRLSKEPPLVL